MDAEVIVGGILTQLNGVGQVLWNECRAFALGAILTFVTWKIMVIGYKTIHDGANPFFAIGHLTTRLLLLVLLVVTPFFQPLIFNMAAGMDQAGRTLGAQVLGQAKNQPKNKDNPILYWSEWAKIGDHDSKFSLNHILNKFWGESTNPQDISRSLGEFDNMPSSSSIIASIFSPRKLIQTLMIFMAFGFFVSVFIMAISAIIGVAIIALFAFIGAYLGPWTAFYLVMAFGVATMPLIIFDRYRDIWIEYLVFLSSLPIAIFFYYVLSAVGYVLTDSIYSGLLCPEGGKGIAAFIKEQLDMMKPGDGFLNADGTNLNAFVNSVLGSSISGLFTGILNNNIFHSLLKLFTMGALWMTGIAITSAVLTMGIGMACLAPAMAVAWQRAFCSDAVISFINQKMEQLQGATMSAIGGGLRQGAGAITQGVQAAKGMAAQGTGLLARLGMGKLMGRR